MAAGLINQLSVKKIDCRETNLTQLIYGLNLANPEY